MPPLSNLFFTCIAIYVVWKVIYALFLSPLRSIPGPFFARITSKWLTVIDLLGFRTKTIHYWHQVYGPSVRVGPNEVSYSNVEMVPELYGQQTPFIKAKVYESFVAPPFGVFSMRDKNAHSQRRRLLSHAFSQASLWETEPVIQSIVSRLTEHLRRRIDEPVDMLFWFRLTAYDIVGELFLGQPSRGLEYLKLPPLIEDMDRLVLFNGLKSAFPWPAWLFSVLPLPGIASFLDMDKRIIQVGKNAVDDYLSLHGSNPSRRHLLSKIVDSQGQNTSHISPLETHSELANLIFAGTDTTSGTLTYLFWELARNPEWQRKLRDELLSCASLQTDGIPTFRELGSLPILDAVVNEALRLHPAVPASLQRESPAGGRTLNGTFVPQGTVVSMQCYTTHRDTAYFPEPDSFLPTRWLKSDSVTKNARTMFMPFSLGPRGCLGKNMAMMELKVIASTLVSRFDVRLAPGTTEKSMAMEDHFIATPKAKKCELIFSTLNRGGGNDA